MEQLNRNFLKNYTPKGGVAVSPLDVDLPERVLQFGEGNFLRAFVDWMFDKLNRENLFNGRVVVVQPIERGLGETLNQQDGLYTLLLRGVVEGELKETREIITSLSRCINPYENWESLLRCAESPDMEIVVSNTTEAGILFDPFDTYREGHVQSTFPGKLTAFLYHRWRHFDGDPSRGMVMIPCELIEENGINLRKRVLQFGEHWNLPGDFLRWIKKSCTFVNTLVDRVVTGYPQGEVSKIEAEIGYSDKLLDTAEYFHLWVLEGPKELSRKLPFHEVGLNVVWTEDQRPYRNRKVRILNGAHTGSVPAAFFCGLDTVRQMMEDDLTGRFVDELIDREILQAFLDDQDSKVLEDLARAVKDRFRNPFISHRLLSIMLNSSSKFAVRNLPSLLDYHEKFGELPKRLVFSLAALITVYMEGDLSQGILKSQREGVPFEMQDDAAFLEFAVQTWKDYQPTRENALRVASAFLSNESVWKRDLREIPGLLAMTGENILNITTLGMRAALEKVLGQWG